MDKKQLYKPFVSKAKNKKYSVYVKSDNKNGKKLIHFGDSRYGQFKDKLGHYKSKDHGDYLLFLGLKILSQSFSG